MNNFDLRKYFWDKMLNELQTQSDDAVSDNEDASSNLEIDTPVVDKNQKVAEESPVEQKTQSNVANVFSQLNGSTISKTSFTKLGNSSGELKIFVSNSNLPFKLSWSGNSVTVTLPNGNLVSI